MPSLFSWIFCKCRYNVFNLSSNLTRPHHWGVMRIYRRKLLAVFHHLDKFGDLYHFDSANILFVTWPHLTTCLTGYVNLWVEPLHASQHLSIFGGHWSSTSKDIKHLIWRVTSQNHVIERSCNVMGGSSSLYITTSPIW